MYHLYFVLLFLQDPVKPRRVYKSDNSDSDVEVVSLEKQSEKVKSSGKNVVSTGKGTIHLFLGF
jgi:hypothetical protein